MPVASLASDLLTTVCVAIVLGMAALLLYRGTRSRPEDQDPEDR